MPNHPTTQQFAEIIHADSSPETVFRIFKGALMIYNCNSLKEGETPTQDAGVIPFPGMAAMLENQFAHYNALIVGVLGARSGSPSLSNIGHYIRVIPPFGGDDGPQGDVDIWVNSEQPWDPKNPATVIQEHHLQVTVWGPKYFILNIKTTWLRLDVACAHAPHTWNQEARTRAEIFWKTFKKAIRNMPKPHAPCLLLADLNTELTISQTDNYHIGFALAALALRALAQLIFGCGIIVVRKRFRTKPPLELGSVLLCFHHYTVLLFFHHYIIGICFFHHYLGITILSSVFNLFPNNLFPAVKIIFPD